MSERLFKFLLSELSLVRIRCQSSECRGIVEVPIEELGIKYHSGRCPLCNQVLQAPGQNHLVALANAMQALAKQKDHVQVEFVLPDTGN